MKRNAEDVYLSLIGELVEPVPGIRIAYEPGSECDKLYEDMLSAYGRICQRLGCGEEDKDVEQIINSLLEIQKILCLDMYAYGYAFRA